MLKEDSIEFAIKQAITSLLVYHPFYGFLVQRMGWRESSSLPTLATNGRDIIFNSDFFRSLTVQERVFVIAHEIQHCMFAHLSRLDGRDMCYWNMAADYAINGTLVIDKVGTIPKRALYEDKYLNKSADEIYEDLKQNKSKVKTTLDDHGYFSDNAESKDGSKVETFSENSEEFKKQVAAAYQLAKMAGKVPASIEFSIEQLLNPKINWRTLLQTSIQSIFKSDISWQRPNRRVLDPRFILPSMKIDDTVDVCISIDTSGSITDEMRLEFLSEISGILSYYKSFKLKIWCFDTNVHNFQEYDQQSIHLLKNYVMAGGGGTDIGCNFKFMKDKWILPKQFVCLTDGYNYSDDWGPSTYCPTTWIIHSNKKPDVPFGQFTLYK